MAKHQVLSEKYLLSALERIAKNSTGYAVLYISASKLKPKHRHPKFLKILEKFFDGVVGVSRGAFFPLKNGDFAILGRDFTQSTIDEAVAKLKEGTSNDPILHGKNSSEFATVFVFPDMFQTFYDYIANLAKSEKNNGDGETDEPRALAAGDIEGILRVLEQIDVSELVKRQSVVQILGAGQFKVKMQEFFVAVKDLNLLFDGIDLQSNRWLYLYMMQHLDKRVLQAFFSAKIKQWPELISLNLNMQSVSSYEFQNFAKEFLPKESHIVVEVQMIDVLNNLQTYFEIKEILARSGHKILLDGVTVASLKLMNLKTFNPDMIKIFWEPLLEFAGDNDDVKQAVELLGRDNVILAKCDSDKALAWGVRHGISSFQGPFMDNLEVAFAQRQCVDAKNCTLKDCLRRKRLLSGGEREKCSQREILEKLL